MPKGAGSNTVTVAGQRPAYAVIPPALARHVLFRIPHIHKPHLPAEPDAQKTSYETLLKPINDYLEKMCAIFPNAERRAFWILKEHEATSNPDDNAPQKDDLDRVVASETLLCLLQEAKGTKPRIRLRIDVHSEHVTLTHIVDQISGRSSLGRCLKTLAPDDVASLYDGYWEKEFLPTEGSPSLDELLTLGGFFKKPYAEFRGVVVGLQPARKFHKPGTEPFAHEPGTDLPPPSAKRITENIAAFLRNKRMFLWTLVKTEDEDEARRGAAMTEAVVCGMLDGNALYASALIDRPGIVRYLAAYDGNSSSQLGRFVRRLHTLGELRLNALLDFNEDHEGNRENSLRRVSQKIRRLAEKVDAALREEPDKSVSAQQIAELSREHTEASRTIDTGVVYRVERSHNYALALEKRIADLRLVPIEGWQSYDAFVRRYHSQDHDYIAAVGRRYQALGQKIDRLIFLHQSRSSEDYQRDLKRAVGNIESLQERAEDIAILAVIYYGAASISHLSDYLSQTPTAHGAAEPVSMVQVAGAVATAVLIIDTLFLERRLRMLMVKAFQFTGGLLSVLLLPFDYPARMLWRRIRPAAAEWSLRRKLVLDEALPPAEEDELMKAVLAKFPEHRTPIPPAAPALPRTEP